MFPIRDHNPSGRTPYVTYALIAANVVIFLGYWLVLPSEEALNWFFFRFGLVPAAVTSGQGWAGFLTSMFLHGGWMHLFGNMLFLYIFGDNLEDLMGHVGFLVFYLAAGLAAAAGQVLADPWSPLPMVGASGAIAGVMGGYLLLFPRAKVDVLIIFVIFFRIFPIPAWIMLGLWFGLQLISGLSAPSDMGGVAYWAHSGGFLAGLVFTLPFWLRKGGPAFWSVTHGQPPHPHPDYALQRSRIPVVRRRR
ncbi:rhomboid family intramembrane serine protease [Cereibacter changlensis JA139]|uniref:Rhomboid family intramembrane serine protease n=2 Tax=Cereibacter changlensis TaxID=402884 RepID=A0A2T4JYB0_9RHOB|nr:rhomboid family intramembrane serine protease [Cereibacter changlensis]PTE22912.1 rhomboid family intramembrane serine protease [Cereibacter changlensis JA139]PZX55262.1 membrane associated rhomboid family serine protease [Cereibacter changlensis]